MSEWIANFLGWLLDFSNILNASIAASWMVLAVIVLRFLLKKAPRWIHVALWGLVAVRLLLPFSIESSLSLIPSAETIPHEILQVEGTQLQEPAYLDVVSNPIFPNGASVEIGQTIDRVQVHMTVMTLIWLIGVAVLLVYTITSYWHLRRKVREAVILRDNIFQSENTGSPFILGIIKPRIYLPYKIEEQTLVHVIAHEQAHIQRKDHWWKPLGFLLLTIHWFNPLMWLGYVLLCRDIELACDEKVIKNIDNEQRANYSQALVACSVKRPMIAACPLAFGEVGVKERVKSVLNYKKPAFWIIVVAVVACIVVAVCFLTNPSDKSLSGKLGVSMDMAVAENNHSPHSAGNFIATDYDVLRITKEKGKTTVYAWVYYAEYSFDGTDVKMESASHIPTAVTFDTYADDSDSSTYDVIEYWIPGDGSDYAKDIREKFPLAIQAKAFDTSGAAKQKEKCLKAARDYYGVGNTAASQWDE